MTYKWANFGAVIAQQQRQGYHPRSGGSSGEAWPAPSAGRRAHVTNLANIDSVG